MGFAIPTQIVQPTVDSLVRYGKVSHSYIGVGITDVTPENAKFFDLKDANGAVISEVQPDSPGAHAGLKVGDVITGLDGKKVSDAGQLQAEVSSKHPGTKVTLDVLRDGKSVNVPVTLEELGSKDKKEDLSASADSGKPRWGVGIADLTSDVREQLQAPQSVKGAVIQRVQPGSPAEEAGLQPGEVIQSVNRQQTPSASDVQKALASVPKGQDAMVLIWGNGGSTFRVLHGASLEWPHGVTDDCGAIAPPESPPHRDGHGVSPCPLVLLLAGKLLVRHQDPWRVPSRQSRRHYGQN
jgi:serine protease Do